MKKTEKEAPKVFLPKKIAWISIIALVYLDAVLDLIAGKGMGNPLWVPFVDAFGKYVVLLLPIFLLLIFYILIKILARIVQKVDKTPFSEEILLTALVVVYSLFDVWLVSVGFLGFNLIRNFRWTIPFLIVGGLAYALWAQKRVKKRGEK